MRALEISFNCSYADLSHNPSKMWSNFKACIYASIIIHALIVVNGKMAVKVVCVETELLYYAVIGELSNQTERNDAFMRFL